MAGCRNPKKCDGIHYICGYCRLAYPNLAAQYDARKREQQQGGGGRRRRNNNGNGAYGTMGSRSMYYEEKPDGSTDIFPDGMPRGHHDDFPHDHIVVDTDGDVGFTRIDGEVTMDNDD